MKLLANSNYLSWRDIPKTIKQPFGKTTEAFTIITEFCNDQETDFKKYASKHKIDLELVPFITKLLGAMYMGDMYCTHEIYLKCFHIALVHGEIDLEPVDILAIDEVQDLSPIMLDLIKLYPAKVKVLVGDPYQSIFSFLGCTNAFHHFPDAIKLHLSQSFRCSTELAFKVQDFVHKTFDDTFVFNGYDYPSITIKTKAYLTRTNNELITKMIELNKLKIPYKLSTKAKLNQMFEWPLALLRIKPGNIETNPKFTRLQHVVNIWGASPQLQKQFTKFQYILREFEENLDIVNAIKLIANPAFTPEDLIYAFKHAKLHQTTSAPLSLLTVHTSKGSTFDEVELAPDMNTSIEKVITRIQQYSQTPYPYIPTNEEIEGLYLYYVAVTRARYTVINAKYL